ncbi:hypothetical protein [Kitasatospora cineracea]|uniref:hypothetical protein n=1 Tax=Kitasatospora cineracea TaxID=88074 RepID=UPI003810D4D5
MYWNEEWFRAYEDAAGRSHAIVERHQVSDEGPVQLGYVVFEHIAGGGQCAGCWRTHINVHQVHEPDDVTGLCGPCVAVQQRRGPLTRLPGSAKEFMCEDCRAKFREMHERGRRQLGQDPDPRLYRDALTTAREDAQQL